MQIEVIDKLIKKGKMYLSSVGSGTFRDFDPFEVLQTIRIKKNNKFLFRDVRDLLSSCLYSLVNHAGNLINFRQAYVNSQGAVLKTLSKEEFFDTLYPEVRNIACSFKSIVTSLRDATKSTVDFVAVKIELYYLCKEMRGFFSDLCFWSPSSLPPGCNIYPSVRTFLSRLDDIEKELHSAASVEGLDTLAESLDVLLEEFCKDDLGFKKESLSA